MTRSKTLHGAGSLMLFAAFALPSSRLEEPRGSTAPSASTDDPTHPVPSEQVEVEKVVDGDTVHVKRDGKVEKLRLLSVDTEERLGAGFQGSQTKPQTVFGEECALWAQRFFADLAGKDGKTRVGLVFPGGDEERDMFGRLLCHLVLPDGTDFNLLLVQKGKSPYFNKYGNDRICHAAFVAAQKAAQEAELGIWNPATNEPKTPGAPSAKRPYPELCAWWEARAEALDDFARRSAAEPERVVSCDDPEALAVAAKDPKREVEAFGEIERFHDEDDGSLTVEMRASDEQRALRIKIPKDARAEHESLDLEQHRHEFEQNFFYVRGTLHKGKRGLEITSRAPDQWRLAGPEPADVATKEAATAR